MTVPRVKEEERKSGLEDICEDEMEESRGSSKKLSARKILKAVSSKNMDGLADVPTEEVLKAVEQRAKLVHLAKNPMTTRSKDKKKHNRSPVESP
jgi:hypothetical protein